MSKRKIKKNIFIPIIIILLIIGGVIIFFITKENTGGYSNKEYKVIKEKVNDLHSVIDFGKNDTLFEIINSSEYKDKNLKKYINYIKNNKNAPSSDILKIVNSNYNILNFKYNKLTIHFINEKYFITSRLQRYINYYNKNYTYHDIVTNVNCNLDFDYYTHVQNTDLEKNTLEITNKYYKLKESYKPDDLVTIATKYNLGTNNLMRKEAYNAFVEMANDALSDNISLKNASAFRSYDYQSNIYNKYVQQDGKKAADTYSARAGYSEHQTGLATDINSVNASFQYTKEYKWLITNAYKYGFILRYPKGKENLTGYVYEPWHYRYVGKKVSKIIQKEDLTFEEYYAYYIEK